MTFNEEECDFASVMPGNEFTSGRVSVVPFDQRLVAVG
jgi:hypothetical protein